MTKSTDILVEYLREDLHFGGGEQRVALATARIITSGDKNPREREIVTLKGPAQEGVLIAGMEYRFYGRWKNHPKYGRQFWFDTWVIPQPITRRGICKYLQRAPHIGPVSAERIFELWGQQAANMLRLQPADVAARVPRLTVAKADQAAAWLQEHVDTERVTMQTMQLLDGRGFGMKVINKAIEKGGNKTPELIQINPFWMLQFPSCGWAKCDNLYALLGKNPNRLKRQALCILHYLQTNMEGHTWFLADICKQVIKDLIASTQPRPMRAVNLLIRAKKLVGRRDGEGRRWIALTRAAKEERLIAKKLRELTADPHQWPDVSELDEASDAHKLTAHQREKFSLALRSAVAIIGGRPGCGKTTAGARLIRWACRKWPGQVLVCAPTGKAAARLAQVLCELGLDVEVTTIHRMLGVPQGDQGSYNGEGPQFIHNERYPLRAKLIVVDEFSMCGTPLFAALLRATPAGCHLALLGDVNQLPPVEHGGPLRDMIAAGVCYGELQQIIRNEGRIVQACSDILDKRSFETAKKIVLPQDNLYLATAGTPERQISKLEHLLAKLTSGGRFHPISGCQVVTPLNENSAVARVALNQRLQRLLNPGGAQSAPNPFRVGDKIICRKNHWPLLLEADAGAIVDDDGSERKVFVANGEQGIVTAVEPLVTIAEMDTLRRVVRIPHGGDGEGMCWTGCWFDLAYAISGHGSQGSEWPLVVVMLDAYYGAKRVCSREWLYTVISRAKQLCILIGTQKTAFDMCQRVALDKRKTFLAEDLLAGREALAA